MLEPIIGVRILDHIAPTVFQRRSEQCAEADNLVVCLVAAIIEDDIERAKFCGYLVEKIRVCLAADSNVNIFVGNFVSLA